MPTSPSNKPVIALTMGDPSGIGPEIILKSLAKPSIRRLADFIIIGDANVLRKTAESLSKTRRLLLKKLRIIELNNISMGSFSFGKNRAAYGKASIEYIKRAYGLIEADMADAIVTAPINKSAVARAGFKFSGHTEFLASLSGAKKFVMMLTGGPLRVSLVTRHIPMSAVSKYLSVQGIADTIAITLKALKTDFSIPEPVIGVCALNPHSGEDGLFGKEESEKIAPAVKRFGKTNVAGPISADAIFYDAYRGKFDAVICLYHDQGLIPLKMIARDSGVNITLGLNFVRTSPDHGTAFDIAGAGKANPLSMESAIKEAVSMAANRKAHAKQKRY